MWTQRVLKIFIILSLVSCVFLAGMYVGSQEINKGEVEGISTVDDQDLPIKLILDFGNGKIEILEANLGPNVESTVWDVLQELTEKNNLVVKFREYAGLGIFVEQIGEQKNSGSKYWQYWLNGEYAKVGASSQEVKNGDVVEWKFIKGQM